MAEPAPQTKVQDLTGQINGVIDTMKRNMGLLLERKVNDLLEKSKEMEDGVSLSSGIHSFNVISVKAGCIVVFIHIVALMHLWGTVQLQCDVRPN